MRKVCTGVAGGECVLTVRDSPLARGRRQHKGCQRVGVRLRKPRKDREREAQERAVSLRDGRHGARCRGVYGAASIRRGRESGARQEGILAESLSDAKCTERGADLRRGTGHQRLEALPRFSCMDAERPLEHNVHAVMLEDGVSCEGTGSGTMPLDAGQADRASPTSAKQHLSAPQRDALEARVEGQDGPGGDALHRVPHHL